MYSKKVLIFKNPNLQIIPQFGRGNTTVSIFGMNLTHIFFFFTRVHYNIISELFLDFRTLAHNTSLNAHKICINI